MAGAWTHDELEALVAGASLSARDRNAQAVSLADLPAFADRLDAQERLPDDPGWVLQLVNVHPDDRPRLVNMWRQTLAKPGELVTQRLRVRAGTAWADHQMQYLNLVHHPDVGAVLVVHRVLSQPAVCEPAPAVGDGGSAGSADAVPVASEAGDPRPGLVESVEEPLDRRFSAATEAASCVAHLDMYGMVQRAEGPVEELFGEPPSALVGEHVFHFVHPQDHAEALAVWLQLLREPGCSRTVRQRLVRADGRVLWAQTTLVHLPSADGDPTVLSIVRDVTEDVEGNRHMARTLDELVGLADSAPLPLWRAGTSGRIAYANRAFRDRFGGVPVIQAVAVLGDRGRIEAEWVHIVASGGEHTVTVTARDGALVRLGCRVVPGTDLAAPIVVGWAENVATDAPVEPWHALAADLTARPASRPRR